MSSQQFCLKWNNHTSNMLNVFEHLLSTEALVDVTLACDGLSLKAHKMVLSACSPFFQSLFLENPCKHPIVIMKDMSYKDLKAIIDFMYRGEVNVSQDQLSALLKTAETLKVKGLAEVTGENRQAAGVVQQEISTPQSTPSSQTPTQNQQSMRPESPPMHGKRKRGRPRKRSLSDSNRSDDELVPSKIKEPDSPEIEELSGDASMDGAGDMLRSNSSSQSQVHQPSVNTFSSSKHHSAPSHHQVNAQVEEPPSGDDNEFEVEPSKLLEQTLTTDNVPSTASSNIAASHFNLPSSSGIEISQVGLGDSQALVPVSAASDALSSTHMQGPDSPQDIKPAILTFDEPPISPVAGPSHQSSDRSMMMYMDQSSMPGPSNYQDQSLVQHDSQPQGTGDYRCTVCKAAFSTMLSLYRHKRFCHFVENTLIGRGEGSGGVTRFYCHLCPYTSNYKHNVLAHVRRHSGERPHKCTECQKGFVTKTELRVHFRIHSGEKPYRCEFCPETFSRKMHLDVHKGVHFK